MSAAQPAQFSCTLELGEEGAKRFKAALEGMQKINPSLTAGALMVAIFLYGLDKVELELAVAELARDKSGQIIVPRH